MTEERPLSWIDEQQLQVRIVRESEAEAKAGFYEVLYGEGQNGRSHLEENIALALGLKQRGQHV